MEVRNPIDIRYFFKYLESIFQYFWIDFFGIFESIFRYFWIDIVISIFLKRCIDANIDTSKFLNGLARLTFAGPTFSRTYNRQVVRMDDKGSDLSDE